MFIKMFASGTNVQRLAKSAKSVDGVLYATYSELEASQSDIIKRKFYQANLEQLKKVVESQDATIQPSWTKVWGKPNSNKKFIQTLFSSFVGQESLIPGLNLTQLSNESISCFMVLTSAYKEGMEQTRKIVSKHLPNYNIVVLNGDNTSNKQAEDFTTTAINEAKLNGQDGVIIISNQMGSRSYSISEIQATIMAYDRGSVDASQQKVSRCLTPGNTFDGDYKEYGHIVDISFDPNRSENIESLLIDEIIQTQKAQDVDFPTATSFVLNTIDLSKVNEFGYAIEVTEANMFELIGDNENLLRVANITADLNVILENGLLEQLAMVNSTSSDAKAKKTIAGEDVLNRVKMSDSDDTPKNKKDPLVKQAEQIINAAIQSVNNSATSVFYMADGDCSTYRSCLRSIRAPEQFTQIIGVAPTFVEELLDLEVLNEPLLDVMVQNSKKVSSIW